MVGTTEGGKKAAETRGHEGLSKAGQKSDKHSHGGKTNSNENNPTTKSNQNQSSSQSRRLSQDDD